MRNHAGSEQTPVEEIFRGADGERWFGDGPPRWTQGRSNRPAMIRRQARLQRRKLVKALRRHGKGNNAALRLAERIAACRPGRRCLSGACPECMRATQRFSVATNADLLARSGVSTVAVSVVFSGAGIADGDLARWPSLFGRISRRLHEALRKAGVRQAVGGFDISANEHQDLRFVPHYRPHAWIIVPASQFGEARRPFANVFRRAGPCGARPTSKVRRRPAGSRLRRQNGFR